MLHPDSTYTIGTQPSQFGPPTVTATPQATSTSHGHGALITLAIVFFHVVIVLAVIAGIGWLIWKGFSAIKTAFKEQRAKSQNAGSLDIG